MRRDIITSVLAMLLFTLLLGIAYPLAMTGVGQVAFNGNANGQRVKVNGRVIGSKIIGQPFTLAKMKNGKPVEEKGLVVTEPDPRYFQSRPSATEGGEYNAAASAFSNLGPNSKLTKETLAEHIKAYLELERPYTPGLTAAQVPVDAANTSGSNLDPEISPANARIQAHRIAAVRRLPLARVLTLVEGNTSGRGLGFSGEPGVNVLELNLALDRIS